MNLLSYKFWFKLRPGLLLPIYQKLFIALIIFFIALFLLFWLLKSRKKNIYTPLWAKLYSFSLTNAFIGLILWFFNYELIPFLSSRFWFLVWALIIIVWLAFIFKYLKKIPEKRKKFEQEKEYKKYIP